MKFEFMLLCLIIPGLEALGPRINVMLKPLIDELKRLLKCTTVTRRRNLTFEPHTCGRSMISRHMTFLLVEAFIEN
jgi:hypothetical protein